MSASFKLYFMKAHILQIHFEEVFFMFKKTRVRQIIEQLQKNLSDWEISGVLGVSRNSLRGSGRFPMSAARSGMNFS